MERKNEIFDKKFYLMVHPESDSIFISPASECEQNLKQWCEIISEDDNVNTLIIKGFSEASKTGFHFAGYSDPEDKKYQHKRKEVEIKAGTINPVKLKHKK